MLVHHVISGLDGGGAERMLLRLVAETERDGWRSRITTLTSRVGLAEDAQALGVPLVSLGVESVLGAPRAVARLASTFRRERPDLVVTWMNHANLVGGLAASVARRPVVWNVRQTDLSAELNSRSTVWSAKASAALSRRVPRAVVVNARAAFSTHAALGFDTSRFVHVPNGFDTTRFSPEATVREEARGSLGFPRDAVVVGWLGRDDPHKDPATFLRAARIVLARRTDVRVVAAGPGIDPRNPSLAPLLAGFEERARLLGPVDDAARFYRALDVFALSSASEGFPNVVAEAMACGVPCVATEVGEVAEIVGPVGSVVPPRDPDRLAAAILDLADAGDEKRKEIGSRGRARVEERFALRPVAKAFAEVWTAAVRRSGPPSTGEV